MTRPEAIIEAFKALGVMKKIKLDSVGFGYIESQEMIH